MYEMKKYCVSVWIDSNWVHSERLTHGVAQTVAYNICRELGVPHDCIRIWMDAHCSKVNWAKEGF